MNKLQKCLIKVITNTTIMPNDDKKEDHNTGASDGIKKFLMKNLTKNYKNGALSRNLIKSHKKVLYQKPYQES